MRIFVAQKSKLQIKQKLKPTGKFLLVCILLSPARKPSLTNEERIDHLSFSEGAVKVEVLMGDITKQTTNAIVNSVHGNLDLSASMYV